eukprot:EG_transcript_2012
MAAGTGAQQPCSSVGPRRPSTALHLHAGLDTGLPVVEALAQVQRTIGGAAVPPLAQEGFSIPTFTGEDLVLPTVASLAYLYARPGVITGAFDTVVAAPMYRMQMKKLDPKKIEIGRKLGSGGFGEVYLASVKDEDSGREVTIVLKRVKEFGEAETWMNERINRALPGVCARMVDSFEIKPTGDKKPSSGVFGLSGGKELWLAFDYEGEKNLAEYMQEPNFPFNLEQLLFGRRLNGPKSPERKIQTIREIMRQLVFLVSSLHNIGIVHRDVKPQNCIVTFDGRLKLIDLGGAADLRTGINYAPKQYIIDPRFAPPEMTVMQQSTPAPPPIAVATFLAPALWILNTPDKFDVYSLGVTFLQLCFAGMRSNDDILAFNDTLKDSFKYDLQAWRESEAKRNRQDYLDGFALLDLDNGAGWDLLKRMMQFNPRDRPSTTDILRSAFMKGTTLTAPMKSRGVVDRALEVVNQLVVQLYSRYTRTPTDQGIQEGTVLNVEDGQAVPESPDDVSRTQTWWEGRKRAVTIATRPPTLMERLSDQMKPRSK